MEPISLHKYSQRKYYENQTERSVSVQTGYLFRVCFCHMYGGYSNLLQQNNFIVIVHLIQGSLHQPGNKIFLTPDQKRVIPHISEEQQQREKSVSAVSFITSALITDRRLQL